MKNTDTIRIDFHRKNFDLIAEYIKDALNVDIRQETKSRKRSLVELRCLFFQIVFRTSRVDLATIGGYLGKDHATVLHALKSWERNVKKHYGKYLIAYLKIKDNASLSIVDNAALEYELKINKLEEDILDLNLALDKQKNQMLKNVNNHTLRGLLELGDDQVALFIKTRLEPFLKMNKLNNLTKTTNKILNIDVVV